MKHLGSEVQMAVKQSFGPEVPFEKITDIVSPQLVSQRLYSAIRRRDLCVVDWTNWSANVFYELGVRLAINRFSTVSILAGEVNDPAVKGSRLKKKGGQLAEAQVEQRLRLVKLLAPIKYKVTQTEALLEIKERHEQMIKHATNLGPTPPVWGDIPFDYVYRLIAELNTRNTSVPRQDVNLFLQSQAAVRLGSGGTTDFSSPVLYADVNRAIAAGAEATATEMLLAAWLYLSERGGLKEIQKDKLHDTIYYEQVKEYLNLGERISGLLGQSNFQEDKKLSVTIQEKIDTLRKEVREGRRS